MVDYDWSQEQLDVLDETIEHHRRLYADPIGCASRGELIGESDCPLCSRYKRDKGDCGDCPVRLWTGYHDCEALDYYDAHWCWWQFHRHDANKGGAAEWLNLLVDYRTYEGRLIHQLIDIRDQTWGVCPECEGSGNAICGTCAGSGEGYTEGSTCWSCKGDGEGTCKKCKGSGRDEEPWYNFVPGKGGW